MYKNFKELGDAREIIEQSPPKFMRIFIYYLLIVITLLIIWSYTSKKEISITTSGLIKSENTESIIPENGGTVYEIIKKESDKVEIGDVLFTYELSDEGNTITLEEIKSNTNGVVHYPNGLTKGGQVYAGYEMARVINYEDELTVQLVIANHQRISIKVGQEVRIDIQALSNRDYGFAKAEVISIEADARQDQESGESYYIAYAKLEENKLKDEQILVGMQVTSRMIVKEQRYLHWAIEKLDLWIFS